MPDRPAVERRALDAFTKFMRAHNALTARLAPTIAEHDLTPTQFGILEALHHLGPMNQRTIGAKLLASKGNVTTVVDNLVRDGLVERKAVRGDRRQNLVVLTARGRRRIAHVFPHIARAIVAELAVLSAAEQERLAALCRQLGHGGEDVLKDLNG